MRVRYGTLGERVWTLKVKDEDICAVAKQWREMTGVEDRWTIEQMLMLRRLIEERLGKSLEMICIVWLKNRYIELRKANKFE